MVTPAIEAGLSSVYRGRAARRHHTGANSARVAAARNPSPADGRAPRKSRRRLDLRRNHSTRRRCRTDRSRQPPAVAPRRAALSVIGDSRGRCRRRASIRRQRCAPGGCNSPVGRPSLAPRDRRPTPINALDTMTATRQSVWPGPLPGRHIELPEVVRLSLYW